MSERDLIAAAAELNARVARCHEEVPCPKCGAPAGEVCRALPAGFMADSPNWHGRRLKHPHRERWTQVVAPR